MNGSRIERHQAVRLLFSFGEAQLLLFWLRLEGFKPSERARFAPTFSEFRGGRNVPSKARSGDEI